MQPALTAEQRAMVETAERLARERFAPRAERHDREASFPIENYRDLHQAGLVAITVPKEYGGRGADPLTYALALKAIAAGDASTALAFNMHCTVMRFIDAMGRPEQKARYFGMVVREGTLCATMGSEPGIGMRGAIAYDTRARRVEGGWVVRGRKHFASLAGHAGLYFVWAAVEGVEDLRQGLLNGLIPAGAAGMTIVPTWDAHGMRATASHSVELEDVFLPDEAVLGEPGEIVRRGLPDRFSLGYAATYLGVAEAAYEFIVEYARTRQARPEPYPISNYPSVQWHVGEMSVALEAARCLLYRAAEAVARGDDRARTLALNQAKYCCTEAAAKVMDQALRVAGGSGILRRLPLERMMRDARSGVVMPPANDRCLETIGKLELGLEASTLAFRAGGAPADGRGGDGS